jgi:hypothetical protein
VVGGWVEMGDDQFLHSDSLHCYMPNCWEVEVEDAFLSRICDAGILAKSEKLGSTVEPFQEKD